MLHMQTTPVAFKRRILKNKSEVIKMANLQGYSFKKCDSCFKDIRMHYSNSRYDRFCYSCYRRNIIENRYKYHYDILCKIKG